jgi:hypothetical protein
MNTETPRNRLVRLERELADLKASLPEHCAGTQDYVGIHAASPAHWQKIEDLEEEIARLKSELGCGKPD